VLNGKTQVFVMRRREVEAESPTAAPVDHDRELFERLRALRLRLARAQEVPPYVVFGDRALREMARLMPMTDEELLRVPGVGEVKLARYGEVFLGEIAAHVQSRKSRAIQRVTASAATKRSGRKPGETIEETWRYLEQGLGLEEIAENRGLVVGTIASHVEKLIEQKRITDIDRFVGPRKRRRIETLFEQHGIEALAPVVAASEGAVGYEEAKLVRAWVRAGGGG
jgi:ATP-dependent DNA helicase RecQ